MDELALIRNSLKAIAQKDLGDVERDTGVPVDTLIKLKYGTTKNPRYETVKALVPYFEKQRRRGERERAAS